MKFRIPLSYNRIDVDGLTDVLKRHADLSHQELIELFEHQMASYCGSKYALALNSGTAALHLAMRALDVGRGDHVIVSTFTYVASVSPILYCGATPVFVDSEERTWNMDPVLLEEALISLHQDGKRVKAIVVVHAYGMPAQMSAIMSIAGRFGVPVVEDAAEALGASLDGKKLGSIGDMGVFSFNNNKSITSFGGGVLISDQAEWIERARLLANHAREPVNYYEHENLGYNYAQSPLNAAYGLSQIEHADELVNNRREVFENYALLLSENGSFQLELDNSYSSRWLPTIKLSKRYNPADLVLYYHQQGIEIRRLWKPMHLQPVFAGSKVVGGKVANELFDYGICLPVGNGKEGIGYAMLVKYLTG